MSELKLPPVLKHSREQMDRLHELVAGACGKLHRAIELIETLEPAKYLHDLDCLIGQAWTRALDARAAALAVATKARQEER